MMDGLRLWDIVILLGAMLMAFRLSPNEAAKHAVTIEWRSEGSC
jgi:hypothetical protein